MKNGFMSEHWKDGDGNPAGGVSSGTGFTISWQNGPLKTEHIRLNTGVEFDQTIPPNGAFVEDVIDAVIGRIEHYQSSRFNCEDNEEALGSLRHAMACLDRRTRDREARGVEGTHNE